MNRITRWTQLEFAADKDEPGKGELHKRFLAVVEPALLNAVLDQYNGNRAAAAQMLGIHRTTLRQKLRNYGIE